MAKGEKPRASTGAEPQRAEPQRAEPKAAKPERAKPERASRELAKAPRRGTARTRGGKPRRAPFHLGTGWAPEPPDARDYTAAQARLAGDLARPAIARLLRGRRRLPPQVDLRQWAGPVYFQGGFNTCNAHVVAGLVAYFENKAHGSEVPPSRLFLYKVAKNFLQSDSDTGVYIRQTMGVLKLIGVPPERYWPYPDPGTMAAPRSSDPLLATEPTAFCYAVAADYQAVSYYRLDTAGQQPADLLRLAKAHLAAQVPFAFGFPLFHSITEAQTTGRIPYPAGPAPTLATHAVIAIGYDDELEIAGDGAEPTRGALRIKNSWSEEWGEGGYGWLPYEFVLQRRCRDFWTLTKAEWTDTGQFELVV
jgi:C1A family cysteine protease